MPRSGPITMTFPPFAGAVRTLVLANAAAFFTTAVLRWIAPGAYFEMLGHLTLVPSALLHGAVWQLATYSLIELDVLGILFGMLTLWFCGSMLEEMYGSRWLMELFVCAAVGGGVVASAVALTRVFGINPQAHGLGAWAGIFGVLVAIAVLMGDREFLLLFTFRIRAKYMVAIYLLLALANVLKDGDAFGALLELSGAACGYGFVRFAPRRGLGFGFSEMVYGWRNAYYRWKRRRAGKKFEVYMGKQGRYADPDEKKDPADRRWMN